MFRNACTIARQFTRPVISCRQAVNGVCTSGIGSFVVLNDEGWIATAGHIVGQLQRLVQEEQATQDYPATLAAIKDDPNLTKKEKYERTKALGKVTVDSTQRAGANWTFPDAQLVDASLHPHIDLAIGRLEPFDPAWVTTYPVIKDPTKEFDPGASLCKEGYPFHSVTPTWNATTNKFEVGANPLPFFPIEGIFTRVVEIVGVASPYPLMYLETSSPGLRGQSGGPTFDVHGAIWGIQSQTRHYALGFNPPVPDGKNGETEHQFLNVGWGVHAVTLIGVLTELGVRHTVSAF